MDPWVGHTLELPPLGWGKNCRSTEDFDPRHLRIPGSLYQDLGRDVLYLSGPRTSVVMRSSGLDVHETVNSNETDISSCRNR